MDQKHHSLFDSHQPKAYQRKIRGGAAQERGTEERGKETIGPKKKRTTFGDKKKMMPSRYKPKKPKSKKQWHQMTCSCHGKGGKKRKKSVKKKRTIIAIEGGMLACKQ